MAIPYDPKRCIFRGYKVLKIFVKKFQTGSLEGEHYFFDKKTNTTFGLNIKDRTVHYKIIDGEKVALNSNDRSRLLDYTNKYYRLEYHLI